MAATQRYRTVRAGVFASVSVGVSAAGHAAMSGHELPAIGALAGFCLLLAFGWVAAARERGLGMIWAWMLWGQLALHLTFSYVQVSGSHHGGPVQEAAGQGGPGMFAVHAVAALISGWWLRRGESALFSLLRLIGRFAVPVLLVAGGSGALRPASSSLRRPEPGSGPRVRRGLRHCLVLRGPPRFAG